MKPKAAPTHRPVFSLPHDDVTYLIAEIVPVGPADGFSGYCKYCYRQHGSWWLMPEGEYPVIENEGDHRAMLCGYCEHVSLACFIEGAKG